MTSDVKALCDISPSQLLFSNIQDGIVDSMASGSRTDEDKGKRIEGLF